MYPIALSFALALIAPAALAAAAGGHEHHHHPAAATETAAPATRWPVDAALRQGMDGMRSAHEQARARKPMTADAARATLRAVQDQVSFMVKNCKLEPAADAALHGVLGELMAGAATLEREPEQGLARMERALAYYARRFAHPAR
ncbi:MAG: DnrO protein [Gammaproteobacteria bacterium]|nr:DnrO protein [Gammaproteobacteria bacterium]